RLRVIPAQRGAASNGVDGTVTVQCHVAARGTHVAAVAHLAAGHIVNEEMVLRLAAPVEPAAGIVDGPAHDALLLFEDAHAACEAGCRVVITQVPTGKAEGILAVLWTGVEDLVSLLAGKPDPAIRSYEDLRMDLPLSVDPLQILSGELV